MYNNETARQIDDLNDWIFEINQAANKQGYLFTPEEADAISKAWHLLDGVSERVFESLERSADWELYRKDAMLEYYATRGISRVK